MGGAAAPYLLRVLPLLHVVEFVVLDVAVARERRLPGDGDGGGGAREGADVGSGAGQLDCNTRGNSVSPEPRVPIPGQQPRKGGIFPIVTFHTDPLWGEKRGPNFQRRSWSLLSGTTLTSDLAFA